MKKKNIIIIYRLIYTFISIGIISKIMILGDYERYINQKWKIILSRFGIMKILTNRTISTDFFVSLMKDILKFEILVNIIFVD